MTGVRAAVIGCGDISGLHLAAIDTVPAATLVAVCDTDVGRLVAASRARDVPGFSDFSQLLDETKPDVVHICTPHHTHAALAVEALERGIHVLLEKPLASTRAEADRLEKAARNSGARVAICFQNRYNAPVQAAHAALATGDLGAILGASATVLWHRNSAYYLDRPWRGRWSTGGGGLLMNQAIHTLDLVQWLVGPVASVRGNASTRFLEEVIEVEDTAEMVLQHDNGARSVFYATLGHATNAPVDIEIVTEKATLHLRGDLTITHADGSVETVPELKTAEGERAYWGVSHELLIQDFYAGLPANTPFWIGVAEARASFDIIQDVYDQSFPERAALAGSTIFDTTERKPHQ
jgi:UDP-N-acetyl-2-amino-2-deoxyglucuronate dehydrogenase